jgi:hypothetical protein
VITREVEARESFFEANAAAFDNWELKLGLVVDWYLFLSTRK